MADHPRRSCDFDMSVSKLAICSVLSLQLTAPAHASATTQPATPTAGQPIPTQRPTTTASPPTQPTNASRPVGNAETASCECDCECCDKAAAESGDAATVRDAASHASIREETFDDFMATGPKSGTKNPSTASQPNSPGATAGISANTQTNSGAAAVEVNSEDELRVREQNAYEEFLEGVRAIDARDHARALEHFSSSLAELSPYTRHDRPRAVISLQLARVHHLRFEDTGKLEHLERESDWLDRYRWLLSKWARTEPETLAQRAPLVDARLSTLRDFITRMQTDLTAQSAEAVIDNSIAGNTSELPDITWTVDPVWLRWAGDPETTWATARLTRKDVRRAEPAPSRGPAPDQTDRGEPRPGQGWLLVGSTSLGIATAAVVATVTGAVIARRSTGALGSAEPDEVIRLREREDMGDSLARSGAVIAPIFLAGGIACVTVALIKRQRIETRGTGVISKLSPVR